MEERIIKSIVTLKMPNLASLSPEMIAATATEAALKGSPPTDADAMRRLLAGYRGTSDERIAALAGLHDELEPYVVASRDPSRAETVFERARREFDIYSAFIRSNPGLSYHDPARFARDALEVHRRCGSGANAFRRSGVRISSHDDSVATHFPDWRLCPALMANLAHFISENIDKWPGTCAMVAYGGIIHAHPFADGNGRTARIMHNLVLHSAGCRHFVPISLVASRTGSSLVVKLRRLVLGNDWNGLQRFLLDSYTLSQEWQVDGDTAG